MPRLGANVGIGVGGANQSGPGSGAGLPWSGMYSASAANGSGRATVAPEHQITMQLYMLLFAELVVLGWLRLSFRHNFGG